MMFSHLHTHSYYSLLNGTAPPEELARAAQRHGMKALALTDTNALYGAVTFYRAALEYGLKPVIGAELTLNDGSRLVALARDDSGYANLCQIISTGHLRGGHLNFKLRLPDIIGRKAGLTLLSGGREGALWRMLKNRQTDKAAHYVRRMRTLFGPHFYLELQQFDAGDTLINLRLRDLGLENGIPLVATNDVYVISRHDTALRRTLRAIHHNTSRERVTDAGHAGQYFKSEEQMRETLRAFPEAVENTQRIVEECDFRFKLGRSIFPSIKLPEKESSFSYLWKKSFAGATGRYRPLTREVTQRLQYELDIIQTMGFSAYFLIVKDIVDFCHREHIPCVGRGSAADSLVAYCLGITQADPMRHNLYFERFLNPERHNPPDIDLDICWKNRDRVIDYVYERFGRDHTAMICTFNTFQSRSALRDVAKTYGLPEDEIGKITQHLPHRSPAQIEETVNSLPELRALRHNLPLYREIMDIAGRLSGFPRHLSVHPGGVIIAPRELSRYTPLEEAGKGLVVTQYDMYSIEPLGLVKMDLLGVRSLSIITDCIRDVTRDAGRHRRRSFAGRGVPDFFFKNSATLSPLDLRTIPENDPQVTAYIRSGQTMGCFQLESPAMRGLLKKMTVDHVDDVIVAVALIRPGASGNGGGMKESYIRRRAGLEKTTYMHPALEEPLRDTHGIIIYQEQVLKIARHVAGLSLAQGDILRRAMSKARTKKEFMTVQRAFMQGAVRRGLSEQDAGQLWDYLSRFTGYGFNKAHSATYGTIAYQTAFLKYYFPVEYMCAVLNNQGGFYSRAAYIEETRRMRIPILPPDVRVSERDFRCEQDAIRCGLATVSELTERTLGAIIRERATAPFRDLFDFIRRSRAGERELEHLIKCGALDALHPSAPQLLLLSKLFFKNRKKAELALFVAGSSSLPPFNRYQRILNELELLGFAVSDHPLALFEQHMDFSVFTPSHSLEVLQNKRVRLVGWLVTSRRVPAGKRQMKFLTLEDRHGLFEVVLFPAVYQRYGALLRGHGPYIIEGRVQSRLPGESNIIAERLERIELSRRELEGLLDKGTSASAATNESTPQNVTQPEAKANRAI